MRTHRERLLRIARREGLAPEDALEVVQDGFHSFLMLPEARGLVESEEDSAGVLSSLVRNLSRNRRRRHDRARAHVSEPALVESIADDLPSVDALVEQAEEHVRVLGCVTQLGKIQRAVVTLRLLEGRRGEDVARLLKLAPGHVAVLLHRAKQNLRLCLAASPIAA